MLLCCLGIICCCIFLYYVCLWPNKLLNKQTNLIQRNGEGGGEKEGQRLYFYSMSLSLWRHNSSYSIHLSFSMFYLFLVFPVAYNMSMINCCCYISPQYLSTGACHMCHVSHDHHVHSHCLTHHGLYHRPLYVVVVYNLLLLFDCQII